VIACPPYSEKYGGASVFSTIYVPSRSCPMLVEDPANVGDAVAKIFALSDVELREQLAQQMNMTKQEIEEADAKIRPREK
jgi:5-(carboxyamino)imidazole ribonucleotide mutase